jgi:hypothetical protein
VLRRSRPMHDLCGGGGRGAGELQCRARPWNERERRRASTAFDQKEKGNGGGGGPVERDVEGRRTGPDVRQLRGSGGDGRWSGGVRRRAEAGEWVAHVGCTQVCEPAGGRNEPGWARENNDV